MTLPDPLFDPADFMIPPGIAHVCAGGEPAFLRRHERVFARYAEDKSRGPAGRLAQDAVVARVREAAAALWGVRVGDLGFAPAVADGVAMLADSLTWRDGDEVVLDGVEYPSVGVPFALLPARPHLRLAQGTAPDRHLALIGPRTRVVALSYVSYLTGERIDLAKLRAAADRVGALLVVDFTQASGALPIPAGLADFAFSACYKWLLGTTGAALAFWNRARQPDWRPASGGWYSLAPDSPRGYATTPRLRPDGMCFTRGNSAYLSLYMLEESLAYLARFEPAAIAAHVQALIGGLYPLIEARGFTPTTPRDPARWGANLCIAPPEPARMVAQLGEHGVYAWNGQGRVRFSFHGYNGAEDVARVAAALDRVAV